MHPGPFERHVREAIELNRQRMPLYSAASAGASLGISRRLIRRERMILPFARWIDRRAAPYEAAGIPLLDDIFVSMAAVPGFAAGSPPRAPSLPRPDPGSIARRLRRAFSADGFPAAANVAEAELTRLSVDDGYWCMLRHMLESLRRLCQCAGRHEAAAARLDMRSPLPIHGLLFRAHVASLGMAARLDRRALPLQKAGIPILCRDLPPIPPLR